MVEKRKKKKKKGVNTNIKILGKKPLPAPERLESCCQALKFPQPKMRGKSECRGNL